MKLKDINEMTLYSGFVTDELDSRFPYVKELFKDAKIYGKLNQQSIYKIKYRHTEMFGIKINDELVANIQVEKVNILNKQYNQINVMYCDKHYRGKGLVFTILWFIKNNEKLPLINHGVISDDGIDFFEKVFNTKRFNVYWFNKITGKSSEFSNKDEKISTIMKTDWRIVIEGDNNSLDVLNSHNIMLESLNLFENIGE